jgi:hypothetical protein
MNDILPSTDPTKVVLGEVITAEAYRMSHAELEQAIKKDKTYSRILRSIDKRNAIWKAKRKKIMFKIRELAKVQGKLRSKLMHTLAVRRRRLRDIKKRKVGIQARMDFERRCRKQGLIVK